MLLLYTNRQDGVAARKRFMPTNNLSEQALAIIAPEWLKGGDDADGGRLAGWHCGQCTYTLN